MKCVYILLLCVLFGCSVSENTYDDKLEIQRFDVVVAQEPVDSVVAFMKPAVVALKAIYQDSTLTSEQVVDKYKNSQAFNVFGPDVVVRLQDISEQERLISKAFENIRKVLPQVVLPKYVYGYITPYVQSVVTVDSVMFIGLNHYLGADYPGYESFGEYNRRLKVKTRMPYDVAEAIVYLSYPYVNSDNHTLVSRMLYEGAVICVLEAVLPDATEAELLGMTSDQYDWILSNEALIWKSLAEKRLLHSTDPIVISKLISPAPNSAIVHVEAPGRVGRFIGYKIVKSYLKRHGKAQLSDILSPRFYNSQNTLIEAEYSPN